MTLTSRLPRSARVFKRELGSFLRVCEAVNTPRSLACWLLFRENEHSQYLDLAMPDPESATFRDDYLVSECMRKNPRLTTGIDTKSVALAKWLEGEAACALTNEHIQSYLDGEPSRLSPVDDLIGKTQAIIAGILGPLDRRSLERAESGFRFGPGASQTCSGRDVIPSRKMVSTFSLTPRLYPYWRAILGRGQWAEAVRDISLSHGSRLTFVPKDAKTDRPICIEPHGNIFVQLGIGGLLRHKLRLAGLDLDTQADKNRSLVMVAQAKGLATIDLSSASDTIAYRLVQLLLPVDWFLLLDTARSPRCQITDNGEDRLVDLEKFSSMGNGFTFELESLIFWALARASGDVNAVCFGDDIIIERGHSPVLLDALDRLGFRVNVRKTFLAGRFFESCGVDVHDGVNIRPFYFRKDVDDEVAHFIRVANAIRLYANRRNHGYGCDIRFLPAWLRIIHGDEQVLRTSLPPGYGDDGLIRNFDEIPPSKARHGIEGWFTTVYRRKPLRSRRTVTVGAYLTSLGWGSGEISRVIEFARGAFSGAALKRQLVPHWRDLGPWC